MKITSIIGVSALVSLMAACAAQTDDVSDELEATSSEEEALTARTSFLQGSWAADGGLEGFDIRPNGEFFYDRTLIMNGMVARGGAPFESRRPARETGRVTINTSRRTITFIGPVTKLYGYEYAVPRTGSPVLTLTLKKIGTTRYDGIEIQFKKVESWCSQPVDCDKEEADGTWDATKPMDAPIRNVCKTGNKCGWEFHAPEPQVLAKCTPFILNGIISPASMKTVEITRNAFPFGPELLTVRVKQGTTELQALTNCTGSVSAWDLKCSTPDELVGSFSQFSLKDKDAKTGLYESRVIAPGAPETTMNYACVTP